MWTVVSDPVDIAYFKVHEYYTEFPFVAESDIEHVIYLFKGMRTEDVQDEILSAGSVHTSTHYFVLRVHGFEKGPRPLWEIPEAMELLKAFVRGGGIGFLVPFTLFELESVSGAQTSILLGKAIIKMRPAALGGHPFGGFECWAAARGEMEWFTQDPQRNIPELWSRFLPALTKARKTVDEIRRTGSLSPEVGIKSGSLHEKFGGMEQETVDAVARELERRGIEGVANEGEPGEDELGPTSGLTVYNVDIRTKMNYLVGVAWEDGEPYFTLPSHIQSTSNDVQGIADWIVSICEYFDTEDYQDAVLSGECTLTYKPPPYVIPEDQRQTDTTVALPSAQLKSRNE